MTTKTWTAAEVRAIARQFVDGRKTMGTARGAYLRALIETAQGELGGKADQTGQLTALKAVHKRFYTIVNDAIASDEVLLAADVPRKQIPKERNRRTNFARSAYGTIKRWLRAPGHDLMKLDAAKTTKSQLLNEAPPTRKHALTPQRVHARADKLIGQLVGFTKQIAKADLSAARDVVHDALKQLEKQLAAIGMAQPEKKEARRQEHRRTYAKAA